MIETGKCIKKEYIMGKYFGTDGFRGEANVKLTVEHAFKVGRYLGWYYGRDHKAQIVIGKDTRRSSYMLCPGGWNHGLWCGCIPFACDHNAQCLLCSADGRL